MTAAERSISEMLLEKMSALDECGSKALSNLSHQAHLKMFWEPRRATLCAEYRSDGHLDARLAAAVPNEASAAALRDDAQNATLCGRGGCTRKVLKNKHKSASLLRECYHSGLPPGNHERHQDPIVQNDEGLPRLQSQYIRETEASTDVMKRRLML
jgi:hypothetical protein